MTVLLLLACVESPSGPAHSRGAAGAEDSVVGDTGAALPSAAELVARVAEGGLAAQYAIANEYGWPARTEEGLLVVLGAAGQWSVAGDYNGWAEQAMTCGGEGGCWAILDAAEGGYKFTNGSAWYPDFTSRRYTYDEFGEMSLVATEDQHLERWFAIGDDAMAERMLYVLVPGEPVTHVIYAHDGQNLFDPEAAWGGWRLQDSAPPGLLVVGIESGAARMDEYTHVVDTLEGVPYGGRGDAYAAFVQDTVRPLVRAQYGEPGPVGVLGSSLGGLISLHIADRYPGEFSFAASMSGTLGWGSLELHNETMIERYLSAAHRDTAIYLDSGGRGATCADADGDGVNDDDPQASDNYCETAQMRDVLADRGYAFDVDLWHWWEPDADHNELAWAERVHRPLEIFVSL